MDHKPYYAEAETPDADHPRAGWYVKIDEDGDITTFGPFISEAHADHFAEHSQGEHDH